MEAFFALENDMLPDYFDVDRRQFIFHILILPEPGRDLDISVQTGTTHALISSTRPELNVIFMPPERMEL